MLFQRKHKFCITKILHKKDISNPVNIGFIERGVQKIGCYIIMINSVEEGGPNGIYCLSKSDNNSVGNVSKLAYSTGLSGDSIDIEWQSNCFPRIILHYCDNNSSNDSVCFKYKIKVICCC
jgi:hypothetical protein